MPSREVVVLVTLLVYKVVLIGIGLLAERRNRSEEDYFLGGRSLGPTVAAVSASASSSSAWTLLGASGFAWSQGLAALWLLPACIGGFLLNWFVLGPALRRFGPGREALTVTDLLAGRPGRRGATAIRWLASIIVVVFFTVYVASQLKGAGLVFERVLPGADFSTSVLVGAGVVLIYTLLGGFWAVSITDTLQGLVMAAAALLLPIAALLAVGPLELPSALQRVDAPGYLSLFAGWEGPAAFGFVVGLLGIGLGYAGQPHVVNRFLALREGEEAMRRARIVAIAWAVVVYSGMVLLGLCGRVLLPGIDDAEGLLVAAADELLPAILSGVVIAAVLSAVMSTADSQLLVAASSVTHDLGLRGRSARGTLAMSRLGVVGVMALATGIALWRDASIFDRVLFAWSAMGAAFGPLLLVTVLRGPLKASFTLAAMLTGFGLVLIEEFLGSSLGLEAPWQGLLELVVPLAAALTVTLEAPWPGFFERVVPFAAALAITLLPGARETAPSR